MPGSSQLFNNHIAVDPVLEGVVGDHQDDALDQREPRRPRALRNHVRNTARLSISIRSHIVDRFPAGFRYIEGSARIDGVSAAEPTIKRPRARGKTPACRSIR